MSVYGLPLGTRGIVKAPSPKHCLLWNYSVRNRDAAPIISYHVLNMTFTKTIIVDIPSRTKEISQGPTSTCRATGNKWLLREKELEVSRNIHRKVV